MRRLQGLDAALLAAETRTAPLHMMAILRLDPTTVPGGYSFEALRDFIASRLAIVPPLRYRLVETPLRLAPPVWAELRDIDIDHHVKRAALPAPGGERELADFTGQLAEQPLDRARPLWQMYVVENLAGGEIAIVAKVHHALMDGVAGMEFMASLFSLEPTILDLPPAEDAGGERVPSMPELVLGSVPHVLARPWRIAPILGRTTFTVTRGIARTAMPRRRPRRSPVVPAPRVPWSAPVTRRRNVAFVSVPLDALKRIGKDANVKLNDVVLAIFGGALRRYLITHDALPDASLVAAVPMSVRDDGDLGGNVLSAIFVKLATDVADPAERLAEVHEHASAAKDLHEAIGAEGLAEWSEVLAPAVVSLGAQLLIDRKVLARMPGFCNTVVSNVPGPPITLYFGGARLIAVHPFGPIFHGAGINLTVVSARDTVGFGLLSCPDLVPDLWEIIQSIRDEVCAFEVR